MAIRERPTSRTGVWRAALAGVLVVTLLGLPVSSRAAQVDGSIPPIETAKSEGPEVTIDNFAFSPTTLTIPVGTTVRWINQDDMVHTVTAATRLFSSKELETGDTYSHSFTVPGTYDYFCALHPRMTATIIVK